MAQDWNATLDLVKFEMEMRLVMGKVDKYSNEIKKEAARRCFRRIVNHNVPRPPLLTGSYIASHRVGINQPDASYTVVGLNDALTLPEAQAMALEYLSVIDQAKPGDVICLSNSVNKNGFSWAINVEYAGWKATGPYHVYEHAALAVMQEIQQITAELSGIMS